MGHLFRVSCDFGQLQTADFFNNNYSIRFGLRRLINIVGRQRVRPYNTRRDRNRVLNVLDVVYGRHVFPLRFNKICTRPELVNERRCFSFFFYYIYIQPYTPLREIKFVNNKRIRVTQRADECSVNPQFVIKPCARITSPYLLLPLLAKLSKLLLFRVMFYDTCWLHICLTSMTCATNYKVRCSCFSPNEKAVRRNTRKGDLRLQMSFFLFFKRKK